MKASELRIGNLVLINGTDRKVFKVTLTSLYEGANEYFTPIPITEEWLLKFGFEKKGDCFYKSVGNNQWFPAIRPYSNPAFYIEWDADFDIMQELKFVHQLQNLYFALTGEELEMK